MSFKLTHISTNALLHNKRELSRSLKWHTLVKFKFRLITNERRLITNERRNGTIERISVFFHSLYILTNNTKTSDNERCIFHYARRDINLLYLWIQVCLSRAFAKLVFLVYTGAHLFPRFSSLSIPIPSSGIVTRVNWSHRQEKCRFFYQNMKLFRGLWWKRWVVSFSFFPPNALGKMHLITFPKGNPSFTTACFRSPHLHVFQDVFQACTSDKV